jgi:mono/diheme cytochrome c family protein
MNYPIWDLPAGGLLIAIVAVVHVFVSHFAVGGGLFLVLTERKARREQDAALLDFVRANTRAFTLLTLVFGALTGVGIWFTIGLVHPAATSSLINIFVWGWAIEWTFFVVEIAAALVYFYGWDRLDARTHLLVGWIYFWAAWLSLVVINGILSFMLTPGDWFATRSFWDGLLNPTYVPSVVARTCGAVGLAGVYALLAAARIRDTAARERVTRYAVLQWIAPMVVLLPLTVAWTVKAASRASVPVGEIFGAPGGGLQGILDAIVAGSASGQPIAQVAARTLVVASAAGILLCGLVLLRRGKARAVPATALMLCAFVTLGASEFIREDLRKPFVIGGYMFVNGVRVPSEPTGVPYADDFTVDRLNDAGVLRTALWARPTSGLVDAPDVVAGEGRELFRLECSACHTIGGYLAMRPLVAGTTPAALDGMLARLATPEGDWQARPLVLHTWRGRRMPPFVGTRGERRALAAYLAAVGGASPEALAAFGTETDPAKKYFDENCAMCHGSDAEFPFGARGRSAGEIYELLGKLETINEMMPPLQATDEERRALADHLATLAGPAKGGAR